MSLDSMIDALPDDHVFEVARAILPAIVDVHEPGEAPERACDLLGLSKSEWSIFQNDIISASEADAENIADLLRLVLKSASTVVPESRMREAISDVGERFTVTGIELIALGAFLLVGYIALDPSRKESIREDIKIKYDRDGKIEVEYKKDVRFVNPLKPLGSILTRLMRIDV